MCALTTLRTQDLVTPRRRTQTTRLLLLTRRDAGHALQDAMTSAASPGPALSGMQNR
jgi:hypothetical protein